MKAQLTIADFDAAAAYLGCDVAAIEAVSEVESSGGGFNDDDSIKVLFEGHHFHRYTHGVYDATHPTLSYPKWTRAFYGKNQTQEWVRLNSARELDPQAALLSTSFGRFQVMGFNFAVCGERTVEDFYDRLRESEANQLAAFCNYVQNRGLADELREHRWADFARLYNGPGAVDWYAQKMAQEYERHAA